MNEEISSVSFRIDAKLKKEAEDLFDQLGLNMTSAYNLFIRQAVREGRIPFEISLCPQQNK